VLHNEVARLAICVKANSPSIFRQLVKRRKSLTGVLSHPDLLETPLSNCRQYRFHIDVRFFLCSPHTVRLPILSFSRLIWHRRLGTIGCRPGGAGLIVPATTHTRARATGTHVRLISVRRRRY